jgi:hypothetical protein
MRVNLPPFLVAPVLLILATSCATTHHDIAQPSRQEPGGGDSEEATAEPVPYETPTAAGPPAEHRRESKLDKAGTGLGVEFGMGGGGDDLVTATYTDGHQAKMSAGGLLVLALHAEWTPIRTRERHGFGLGLSAGVKYNGLSADNGSVKFLRYPVIASAHALLHVKQKYFFLARAGLEKDFAPALSGDGLGVGMNASFTSSLGAMGEMGVYWQANRKLGCDVKVRYTHIKYSYGSGSVDGSSLALLATALMTL